MQSKPSAQTAASLSYVTAYLCEPNNDPKYAGDRERFDHAAMAALKDLRTAIIHLPRMPQEIRELLSYHSKQLLSYGGLVDVDSKRVA